MLYTIRVMKGGYKKIPHLSGFTIIEVMIFLAVSGVTFLIAANFINGKEAQTEYYQGMNQSLADVRTMINNVSNGNYPFPDTGYLNCSVSANGPSVQIGATKTLATPECTMAGTVLAPEVGSGSNYGLFTLAGCMFTNCSTIIGGTPTSVYQEVPQVIQSINQTKQWPGSVVVTKMFSVQGGRTSSIGLVGFFASLPFSNGSVYQSGSQPVTIIVFNNTSLAGSMMTYQTQINSLGSGGSADGGPLTNGYVVICFLGPNNQPASITIGGQGGGQQTTSSLDLGKGIPSECL